jgi:hypothetical protein
MTLKEQMAADVAAIFLNEDELAEQVTHNGTEILAVVELGEDRTAGNEFTGDGQSARATIWVSASDVPAPQQGDTIIRTADSTSWTVARIVRSGGGMHALACVARESVGWRR